MLTTTALLDWLSVYRYLVHIWAYVVHPYYMWKKFCGVTFHQPCDVNIRELVGDLSRTFKMVNILWGYEQVDNH